MNNLNGSLAMIVDLLEHRSHSYLFVYPFRIVHLLHVAPVTNTIGGDLVAFIEQILDHFVVGILVRKEKSPTNRAIVGILPSFEDVFVAVEVRMVY